MLIQYLLGLLKSRANLSNNPATVIAQIVSALKTMAQNLNYGAQVLHILNGDPIWAEFKDQNHDLFIMETQKRGMIAGKHLQNDDLKILVVSLGCLFNSPHRSLFGFNLTFY